MDSRLADQKIREALAALASPAEAPAAGVAAALSGALAASVLELAAGLAAKRLGGSWAGADPDGARRMASLAARSAELRERLLQHADEDAVAYPAVGEALEGPDRERALSCAADPPLAVAEETAEIAEGAAELLALARSDWPFAPDAAAAGGIAAAASRAAADLVAVDLAAAPEDRRGARAREAAEAAARAVGELV